MVRKKDVLETVKPSVTLIILLEAMVLNTSCHGDHNIRSGKHGMNAREGRGFDHASITSWIRITHAITGVVRDLKVH